MPGCRGCSRCRSSMHSRAMHHDFARTGSGVRRAVCAQALVLGREAESAAAPDMRLQAGYLQHARGRLRLGGDAQRVLRPRRAALVALHPPAVAPRAAVRQAGSAGRSRTVRQRLLQRLRAPPPHPPRQRRRPLPLLAHMTGSVQASRGSTTPALHLPPWDTCRPPGAAPVCVRSRLLLQAESRSTLPKRWAGRAVCSSGAGRTGLPFTFSPCRLPHRPHNSVPEALPGLVRAARD